MNETPIRANEMVRAIRDQLYEETKSMSPEQFEEFITASSLTPAFTPKTVRSGTEERCGEVKAAMRAEEAARENSVNSVDSV